VLSVTRANSKLRHSLNSVLAKRSSAYPTRSAAGSATGKRACESTSMMRLSSSGTATVASFAASSRTMDTATRAR